MTSITPLDFLRALRHITPTQGWPSRVAVAVSGGPDSIALLHLLANYSRQQGGPTNLVAITIDHGFRAESSQEAQGVATFSRSLGVPHHTLTIPWSSPSFPPLPSSPHSTELPARQARLQLLRQFLCAHELNQVWMAHHRDDQLENQLLWGAQGRTMRSVAKLAGGRSGLAEEVDGRAELEVVRPLLEFEKTQLLAYCAEHSLPFFVDPTNFDPSHTPRNAVRSALTSLAERHPGSTPSAAYHSRSTSSIDPHTLPKGFVKAHEPKLSTLTLNPYALPPGNSLVEQRRIVRKLVEWVSPDDDTTATVTQERTEDARERIWGIVEAGKKREAFTPGGSVWFVPATDGSKWVVGRQPVRSGNESVLRLLLKEGEGVVWDGRFWFRLSSSSTSGASERWEVKPRGRWSLPVVFRRVNGEEEVLVDFSTRLPREQRWEEEGTAEGAEGVKLEWKVRKRDTLVD